MQKAMEMAVKFGYTPAHVSELMDIPSSTIERHLKQYGKVKRTAPPREPKITNDGHIFLVTFILQHKTATLNQLRMRYKKQFNVQLHPSMIYRHLKERCNVTLKWAHRYPVRRNNPKTQAARAKYIEEWNDSGKADY